MLNVMLPVEMVHAWRSLHVRHVRQVFLSPRPVSSSTRRQLMTAGVHYCNTLLVLAVPHVCNARLFHCRVRRRTHLQKRARQLCHEDFAAAKGAAEAQLAKSARADGTFVLASQRVRLANKVHGSRFCVVGAFFVAAFFCRRISDSIMRQESEHRRQSEMRV